MHRLFMIINTANFDTGHISVSIMDVMSLDLLVAQKNEEPLTSWEFYYALAGFANLEFASSKVLVFSDGGSR